MRLQKTSSRLLILAGIFMVLGMILVACGREEDRPKPIVYRPQQEATDDAMTAVALTNAPPTAGPSPTPTITPTPYQTPTQFPDADPSMIVAEVGGREITLAEFQARVRYERWLPFYAIARDIPELGLGLLDLTRSANARTLSLIYTLNEDPGGLGIQVMNAMLTEQVVLREAAQMDLELEQTIYDGRMAARIDVQLGPNGTRPANWDEAYATFIADMTLYTGMTEAQFQEHIRALVYYEQLKEIISLQAELPDAQVTTAVTVQDIILDTREDALDVKERLEAGQLMPAIAAEYDKTPATGQFERDIQRDTEGLPDDIKTALFDASANEVIGPFATEAGWYVALVMRTRLDIASPADLQAVRDEYFRLWIVEKLDNPEYTVEYENWNDFVPKDPLPQDISPLLRTENFILPDDPFSIGPTPTPLPIGLN